jgi:putative transposase
MVKIQSHACDLRKGRVSIPGQMYVITIVTQDRQPFFLNFNMARNLIRILAEHEERGYAETLSFVVMPDHLHWLMQLGSTKELATVVRGVKSLASKRAGRKLWQKGFYDHALRQEEDIKAIARYIVSNPLRAGLVNHHNDYSHWDAVWL